MGFPPQIFFWNRAPNSGGKGRDLKGGTLLKRVGGGAPISGDKKGVARGGVHKLEGGN